MVLSVFTYFLVETPFRKKFSSKVTGRSLVLVLLSLVLINIEVIANKGFKIPSRIPNLLITLDDLVDSKYKLKDRGRIYKCKIEDFPIKEIEQKYQLVFFSESFQYVNMKLTFNVLEKILKKHIFLLYMALGRL